jgi:transposase
MSKPRPVDQKLLAATLERAKAVLAPDDFELLQQTADTLAFLTLEIQSKKTSILRMRQWLFGAKTESSSRVLGRKGKKHKDGEKTKPAGHGRNGAAAYPGAEKVAVPHPTLRHGDRCPGCHEGNVYLQQEPAVAVRITGMAPLRATVNEAERLRCGTCGEVFTAPMPDGIGEDKYDETATGMVGLFKYGVGIPFNRLEKMQQGFGIPMPAATQWDLVRDGADRAEPAYEELVRQGAQGEVLYNDDTAGRILKLTPEQRAAALSDTEADERTGVFTSGIASTRAGRRIALFFTGAKHAGENLADVLARRAAELPPPIQMCDGLDRNVPKDFETMLSNCLTHARRLYVDVAQDFPEECRFVLDTLHDVYKNDGIARTKQMTADERLALHEAESGPLMASLETWMKEQIDGHKTEPNSGLGEAIRYMQKRWSKLTLFLRVPGAPLDNNLCERVLKKAILHRKNALFYKTLHGARVGDIFMSLIHTAELNGANPFEYLVSLLRHHEEVAKAPANWMPWNYRETVAHLPQPLSP